MIAGKEMVVGWGRREEGREEERMGLKKCIIWFQGLSNYLSMAASKVTAERLTLPVNTNRGLPRGV